MFPLFLDLRDRKVVVIGGGPVGRRKARALLESGAFVFLYCLESRPAGLDSTRLDWRTERYQPAHLEGACLVFAAATPDVNRAVVRDARALGIWVNAADLPEEGDCFVPAVVRRGDFVLAIGTGGAGPGLAREVRLRLEADFDEAFGTWVELLREMRTLARAVVANPEDRCALLRRLCSWDWLALLRLRGPDVARAAMQNEVHNVSGLPQKRL